MKVIPSICPYCGCGCALTFKIKDSEIEVLHNPEDEVSKGKPCVKGLTCAEPIFVERIKNPMIRRSKQAKFKEVSWTEALEFIRKEIEKYSGEEIAITGSGELTNEDNYVIQKFARTVLHTNNIDTTARLCHAPTLYALYQSFGITTSPNFLEDIGECDCVLLVGTNPRSNYPVAFNRLMDAKYKRGAKIISVQTIFNLTSEYSDLAICLKPNTEVALFNCILNYLIEFDLIEEKVKRIENFERLKQTVSSYTLERTSYICGLEKEILQRICEMIGSAEKFGIMHGMGLTQHIFGVENVLSLLNLAIAKNAYLLSLRGKVNIQGAGDMGCFPNLQDFWSKEDINRLQQLWGVELPKRIGKTLTETFISDPVKFYYIIAMDPAKSLPYLNEVHRNLNRMFIVLQHHYTTYTMKFANVLLPSCSLLEKEGTITNAEGRVRYVRRVISPLHSSMQDWKILVSLAQLLEVEKIFPYEEEIDIFEEITEVIPSYRHLRAKEIYSGFDGFTQKAPKFFRFNPVEFRGFEETTDRKFNFMLITARQPYHFCTGEATLRSKTLKKFLDKGFCYLNPFDARDLGILDGDLIELESRAGKLKAQVKIDPRVTQGIVVAPFFDDELLVNKLIPLSFDPHTKTPNYKNVAVRIRKLSKRK
ncbi:MAG: molybdopterin-dependent oxidoreductase [Candidatus Nanoarchaeia archaeon]|nr:molybdopterin-dependent oxidoreductase [Candidatus Haiyanarchaeum thermophilum]MCW1302934.1 molybdopterin-dependent oxidoreductase [Candidatus Haiyanarchaeum thermophilum]MCW1303611.1 molybdopterin-dependent oxidoreductase [Candidatus Haiyanarchaeum thermophilum]MCW1306293.1 molybdopterin-dependent oxidoreductase [Candidatus Haiyanarchaeum thermophilum]MCW1307197.1 molybdopterin-dependent oxidoreductase [Candidatus Haiyanarchaeum thermophilum]